MCITRCISIKIRPKRTDMRFLDVLMGLTADNFIPFAEMSAFEYLPIGDEEDIDWEATGNLDEVTAVLNEKEEYQENLGIVLYLNDEAKEAIHLNVFDYGTDEIGQYYDLCLFLKGGKRLVNAERYTDFSWYLEKVLPSLAKENDIGYIQCEDVDGY